MQPNDMDPLTADEAARETSMDTKAFYRLVKDGAFPPGFYLPRASGLRWYRMDVRAYLWLQMRFAKRPPKKAAATKGRKPVPDEPEQPGEES